MQYFWLNDYSYLLNENKFKKFLFCVKMKYVDKDIKNKYFIFIFLYEKKISLKKI